MELEVKVEWLEKGAFLKLEFPTVLTEGQALSETAFGVQEHEKDGLEKVSQRWNGLFDFEKDMAVTLINDGTYGISFVEGCMESSMVLRSLCCPPLSGTGADSGRPGTGLH